MSTQQLVISPSDLSSLKAAGFTQPIPKPLKPPRISLATEGRTKHGKSHFALMTTPEPVAYIRLDTGSAMLTDKAIANGRKIMPKFIDHSKKEDQTTAKKLWTEYRQAIRAVLGAKAIRTLVIDTVTEAWELLQIAEFGKLTQNNKFKYGPINAEFGGLIDEIYYARPDLNTIYIQKVGKLYTASKKKDDEVAMGGDWDGKSFEAKGFKNIDYSVDMSIVHGFAEKQFFFETKASEATRFGGDISGLRFAGEECSFSELGMFIFGDAERARQLGYSADGADPGYWGITL